MLRLLAALGATFLLGNLIRNKESNYDHIGGIPKKDISDEFIIRYRVNDKESNIRRRITRNINTIINNYSHFKIGESGLGEDRGEGYNDYSAMYLLCKSTRADYIDKLEAHYIKTYINHPKNENYRQGSAGKMSDAKGMYYLYIVVR